jgi:amino acid transporter
MDQLKATLGPISGTLMMLNIVLGASLFILPGLAAQQTGPASIVYWLLAILLSLPLLVICWQPSGQALAVLHISLAPPLADDFLLWPPIFF